MESEELKNKFLSLLDSEFVKKLTPPFLALIDEAVESVLDGTTNINGIKAESEDEIMIALNYGLTARISAFSGLIEAVRKIEAGNVVVNYRGTTLKVK